LKNPALKTTHPLTRSQAHRIILAIVVAASLVLSPLKESKADDYTYFGVFVDQPQQSGDRHNASNPHYSSWGVGLIAGQVFSESASLELRLGSLSDYEIGHGTNKWFHNDNQFYELSVLLYPFQEGKDTKDRSRRFISPFLRAGGATVQAVNQTSKEERHYLSLGIGIDIGGRYLPFDLRSELHFLHDDYISATTSFYFKFD